MAIEHGVPLSRLTTIGTGGPARALARPRTLRRARARHCACARARASTSSSSGSARTCSRPTRASTRSCSDSRASSPRSRSTGRRARSRAAARRTRSASTARAPRGLGGFEFACAIPGTAGGGVWMNAGAYGRDWSDDPRARARRHGRRRRLADARRSSGSRYRHSALRHGQVVARVEYRLEPRPTRPRSRRRSPTSSRGARRRSRRTSARSGASSRTRRASSARGGCSSSAASRAIGSAAPSISPQARELHRERGRRDEADCVALMAEARRRAQARVRRRARARGRLRRRARASADHVGSRRRAANLVAWPGDEPSADRAGMRVRQASSSRFRAARPVIAWISLGSSLPAARSSSPSRVVRERAVAVYWGAYATPVFAVDRSRCVGAPPAIAREVEAATQRRARDEPRRGRRRRRRRHRFARSRRSQACRSTAPSRTRSVVRSHRSEPSPSRGAVTSSWLVTGPGKVIRRDRDGHASARCRGSGSRAASTIRVGGNASRRATRRPRRRSRRSRRQQLPRTRQGRPRDGRRADARAPPRPRDPARRGHRPRPQARGRTRGASRSSTRERDVPRRERPRASRRRDVASSLRLRLNLARLRCPLTMLGRSRTLGGEGCFRQSHVQCELQLEVG